MGDSVAVRHLGLAAFLKMEGCQLLTVNDKIFVFDSDIPLAEWRVRYNNSCCMRHDTMVCELRHFLKAT